VYAAVRRALGPRDIVVLDGLNYIKGWRYQLFTEAKNARTPCCVLQIGCSVDRAKAVNEARLERWRARNGGQDTAAPEEADGQEKLEGHDDQEPYEPASWENLVFRYEEPNPMTRWDSPLFTLIWEDGEERARQVYSDIWDAVAGEGRKIVRPNQATLQRGRDAGGDYLYVLDRETQDIVKQILERQGEEGGGQITLSKGDDKLVVELPGKKVGLPQLQRYRRAFIGLNRGGIGLEAVGDLAVGRMRESFVGYLNDAFEKDE
jgi:protein KTI12